MPGERSQQGAAVRVKQTREVEHLVVALAHFHEDHGCHRWGRCAGGPDHNGVCKQTHIQVNSVVL